MTAPKIARLDPVRHTDPDSWEPPRSWTASRIPSARLRAIHLALGDGRDQPNPRMVFSLTETGMQTVNRRAACWGAWTAGARWARCPPSSAPPTCPRH